MVQNTQNGFFNRLRHTEHSDAWLGIRRQDPDQGRRGSRERKEESAAGFDTYDNAEVSVDALKAFLENFLLTRHGVSISAPSSQKPAENNANSASSLAARAAGAYGAAAARNPAMADTAVQAAEAETTHENEDVRAIRRLLADIAILQARGVTTLRLERGETFLESLSQAAKRAL